MISNKTLRILIVEDNPGDEFLLSELLDLSGININALHKAISLDKAIEIIHQNLIDLILLDLSLPDSSGINSFKAMKAVAIDIPIVILSGLTDMKVVLDAINLGAQDYLIKGDFDEKMLAKTILYSMERMRSIKQLQESNERYNLISKATNDMVWDWDLVTGKVYRNKEGWRKIFRTGNKDINYETIHDWDDRIHPEDKEKVKQHNEKIFTSDKDFFEVECRVLRDDNTYAFINDRANIIRNDEGKAIRLLGATQDITERKEAELQVAKSEIRLRSLVQNSSDLISILDIKGYYTYSSPSVKRILGFEPEYMIGKKAYSFIHPDDIIFIKSLFSENKNKSFKELIPFRFKNVQGEWRWLESNVTDLNDNPEVRGYVFNSRDVTERILAEEEIKKLSVIAQETGNVVIITDPHGKIIWVNEAFIITTEYKMQEVLGKKPGDFLQGEETNLAVIRFMRQKLKAVEPFECDIINYSKSGTKYWMRIQCQPQFDANGRLTSFFAIQTDITKEKKAEEILKLSEERYRHLFNNNPASIFIWDLETLSILEVNNTAIEVYGYKREEFLNSTILKLRLEENFDKIKEFAFTARQNTDFKSVNTWKQINKAGEEMFMNISTHRNEYKGRAVIFAVATNVTDKVFLERELEQQRMEKEKEITDAVISAQERERHELGTELHDNINQILASSLLYLGMEKREMSEEHAFINESENLIHSAIKEIRTLSHSLIPPAFSESQLLEALNNIIDTIGITSEIEVSLEAVKLDENLIPDKLQLAIYRIVQQQLSNILKYAAASNVIISLVQENEKITLTIKDDGIGFDTSVKSMGVGLLNIKTRASLFDGDMIIISSPGNGCEMKVFFLIDKVEHKLSVI